MPPSAPPNPAETRRRRLQVAAAVLVAALVAAVIVVASSGGGGRAATVARLPGASEAGEMLAGIPQDGIALGRPDAPVTLVEIADAQCPFCRHFALYELPHVVEQQVRRGRLRIELRLVAFLGPDSQRGRLALRAAARQDRLWQALDIMYYNQGAENSGYLSDAYLRRVLRAVPDLDVARALRERESPGVAAALRADDRLAARSGANATPTFLIGRTGKPPQVLSRQVVTAEQVAQAVDALTAAPEAPTDAAADPEPKS